MFEFGQLRHLGFRYGLLTTMVLAMGQFGLLFILPVLLQNGEHLSALRAGAMDAAPGHPHRDRGADRGPAHALCEHHEHRAFRPGVRIDRPPAGRAVDLTDVSFLALLPGMMVFGLGVGFASSQLTNVILSDIDPDKTGVASGTNTTVRQVGLALGIATFASFIDASTRTSNHQPPSPMAHGQRCSSLAVIVGVGTALSFLIPRVTTARNSVPEEVVGAFESIDVV